MSNTISTIYNPQDKLNAFVCFLMNESPIDEDWIELPYGYGYYFISNKGRVLSLYNNKPRVLNQFNCNGYNYVSISGKDRRVNRLVANAFLPNPNFLPVVHHKDCNKLCNELNNLEWTTHSDNTKEYFKLKQKKESEAAAE